MNKELLFKYLEGNCTDADKIIISEWINSSAENMKEYMAARKLYDLLIWQVPSHTIELEKEKKSHRWNYKKILKIAAILLIGILISNYFIQRSIDNSIVLQTLRVPAGQRAEIKLADGTVVWLNSKTTLTFPTRFIGNKREVKLDGEGYFNITPNKANPFIVKTSRYDVKVWGTRFNLSAYSFSDKFETSLFEGSVEILMPDGKKSYFIKPNERFLFENKQYNKGVISNSDQFLWKDGIISFDNESFTEMVKKLELYFDLKIEIKNNNILKYRCTGKFRIKDGVEHILKVLMLRNKFDYKINDERNLIRIE